MLGQRCLHVLGQPPLTHRVSTLQLGSDVDRTILTSVGRGLTKNTKLRVLCLMDMSMGKGESEVRTHGFKPTIQRCCPYRKSCNAHAVVAHSSLFIISSSKHCCSPRSTSDPRPHSFLQAISFGLAGNTSLQALDFSMSHISDRACCILASSLRGSCCVTKLGLDDCDISLAGWQQLASGIADSTCLTVLKLSDT